MKVIAQTFVRILLIAGVFQFAVLQAQTPYKIKEAKMTVAGTSTLHDWESEVTQVEWKGSLMLQDKKLVHIKDIDVRIPVINIRSTKGKTMDNKTYEAFDHVKNPFINYRLTTLKIIPGTSDYTVNASGTLSMAGATKPVELKVTAKVLANGDVQLTAEKQINMKDFGMVPPTAMMGTIKVGEAVTVSFSLTLTQSKIDL